MRARTLPSSSLALRVAALALAWATLACATGRDTSRVTALAGLSGLRDVSFAAAPSDRRLVAWRATGTFHQVAVFLGELREPLPAGCSTHLALRTARARDGRVVLEAAGTLAPERGDAGARPCAAWPTLVEALDAVSAAIPQRAWTTALVQDGERFELWGQSAGGTEDVRTLEHALAGADPFAAGSQLSTEPREVQGRALQAFHLRLRLRL